MVLTQHTEFTTAFFTFKLSYGCTVKWEVYLQVRQYGLHDLSLYETPIRSAA